MTKIPATLLVAAMAAPATLAEVDGPSYPPPGGVTANSSGDGPAMAGGRNWDFTGFDEADIADGLYYGKWASANIVASMNGDQDGNDDPIDADETLNFGGFSGNVATWLGQTSAPVFDGGSFPLTPVETRFTLTITTLADKEIDFVDAASVDPSFPAGADAVVKVEGDFRALWQFEARLPGGSWTALNPFYDNLQTPPNGPGTATGAGTGFYIKAPCTGADLTAPRGDLNIDDVLAFLDAFAIQDPAADLAEPIGTFNIDDVLAFLASFAAGCP